MKIFLENIFMCLVTFWKSYFPPPPTQNPPPHNRKTTKTPPPTPPPQQQKNHRSKRESKKSKSHTNFITKISNENENEIGNGFAGSWVRDATRGLWVRGATILGFLGLQSLSLSLSLFLSLSLRVSGNDLKVKFWLKIFSRSKALILRSTEILFRKIHFPCATKHPHLQKSISESDLKPKQTRPYTINLDFTSSILKIFEF